MKESEAREIIEEAIRKVAEMSPRSTDGRWLEVVTVESSPYIKEWDIGECWHWDEWPDREARFPNATKLDVGIDAVAVRRSDGEYIAIQCKSRRLDNEGLGSPIGWGEIAKFAATASGDFWAERWIVTNGDNPLASGATMAAAMTEKPLKIVNVTNDLRQQRQANILDDVCEHCQPNPDGERRIQTRSCMQNEAVANSVRLLEEQEHSEAGGLPVGEARGRIILPCGTGKTRISLRIIEELTPPGKLSIVLCPSIALVSQIRREYLQNADIPMVVLAVCSDATAGYDPKKEGKRNATLDPTVDNSNVSASEVMGRVTTDAEEIADWMRQEVHGDDIKVLIGTYQSSDKVSQALLSAGVRARVMIADEAHRTAGLKRKNSESAAANKEEKRLRDFTICHDSYRFPATYRVYQTATPRIYDGKRATGNPNWIVRSMDDETTFGVELYRKSYMEAVRNRWLSDYRIIAMGINDREAFETANILAKNTRSMGRGKLTTTDYLRGLAFALTMGGATQGKKVDIRSCIAFMNTVDKSREHGGGPPDRQCEEMGLPLARRERGRQGCVRLQPRTPGRVEQRRSSRNSEGTACRCRRGEPSRHHQCGHLRRGHRFAVIKRGGVSGSPERVPLMSCRPSDGRCEPPPTKELGYIVCPILIPPTADPEKWLSNSDSEEGWQELGQILLALRAHDQRIEENLEELLHLYIPKPPPVERTIVAVAKSKGRRIQYGEVEGPPGAAQEAVEQALKGKPRAKSGIQRISEPPANFDEVEVTQVLTGKKNDDGSIELRADSVDRNKPKTGEARGVVNIKKTKAKARKMINTGEGGHSIAAGGTSQAP